MLDRILEKLGLKSIEDLKPAERATWEVWAKVLAKPDTTIDDLKKLLPIEHARAEEEILKFENTKEKDLYYKAYLGFLNMLSKAITAPTDDRERLKAMLANKYGIE